MRALSAGDDRGVLPCLEQPALVDHHCHGLLAHDLTRAEFERMLTEADDPGPPETTLFDSNIGFAVRRWCAPVLDLPAHAEPDEYIARRRELGADEVNRRFLRASGIRQFCVDGGYRPESLTSAPWIAEASGGRAYDILRLERIAEETAVDILTGQVGVAHFADTVRERVARGRSTAVAMKSVAAYRVGLDLPAHRPTDREVNAAARRWLAGIRRGMPIRLADPVVHSFLIWSAVDVGLPLQVHTGYGDTDIDLHRCNPLLLTRLLRAIAPTGVPVMLLHCYPFHREAGYLAQVFPNVHLDVGLAVHNVGRRAAAVLAEATELAPLHRFLFATDAFALAELFLLGSLLFRRGLSHVLAQGVEDGDWTMADAERIARLVCADNARRIYRLPDPEAGPAAEAGPSAPESVERPVTALLAVAADAAVDAAGSAAVPVGVSAGKAAGGSSGEGEAGEEAKGEDPGRDPKGSDIKGGDAKGGDAKGGDAKESDKVAGGDADSGDERAHASLVDPLRTQSGDRSER